MRGLPFAVQWIHETRIPLLEIAEMNKLAVCTSLIRSTGAVKPPDCRWLPFKAGRRYILRCANLPGKVKFLLAREDKIN